MCCAEHVNIPKWDGISTRVKLFICSGKSTKMCLSVRLVFICLLVRFRCLSMEIDILKRWGCCPGAALKTTVAQVNHILWIIAFLQVHWRSGVKQAHVATISAWQTHSCHCTLNAHLSLTTTSDDAEIPSHIWWSSVYIYHSLRWFRRNKLRKSAF